MTAKYAVLYPQTEHAVMNKHIIAQPIVKVKVFISLLIHF